MTTLVPFPDLNLLPESASSSAAGVSGVAGRSSVQNQGFKAEPIVNWDAQNPNGVSSDSDHTTPPPSSLSSPDMTDVSTEFDRFAERFISGFGSQQPEGYGESSATGSKSGEKQPLVTLAPPPGFEGYRVSNHVASPLPPLELRRPQELARFTMVGDEDQKRHREIFKQNRMIYDSLRIHLVKEDSVAGERRKTRGDIKASALMKKRGLWLNQGKYFVGSIPGIEIGDVFFYRHELCSVGLHSQLQAGIDFLTAQRSSKGEPIATSIIVSGNYEDDEDTGEVLVYTGHGGQDKLHRQIQDQKLESGNLAMDRSMFHDVEVRVIRGFKYENKVSSKVFFYDGLYKISDCWPDMGKSGFVVYKFRLVRINGQPEMGSARMRFAETLKSTPWIVRPSGYISFDISSNKENVPVYLYNDIDDDREPLDYEYISKSVFPMIYAQEEINRAGCDCSFSCSEDCLCARKNGGELAYDDKGNLLRGKSVVFECGASCKCGPSCKNRVTQKGLRNRLEVFRSKETGWGVRTLDLIHAGAFICEYAGVVLKRDQANAVSMNGDTLVHPGQFRKNWRNWGDLSKVLPNLVRPDYPSLPPLDFALEVSKMRNVASYISPSKEPNVMAQFVLYDHNNLMFPRLMLFALENITPLSELSLDYGSADELNGKLAIYN
ncbi:histone-lysine N-methyltransferase family member SUVH2 [Eutrema salsugineum]|uniref:histone-lysine N-methyltransferase family member SUVH2 n=1 Tax=Eutrema salsugineum TaxID=72664 RepID=UPI000CECFA75|nr:histone-lysine N-methyltransferase family member SUVH2 [Eutrema salsugineum]